MPTTPRLTAELVTRTDLRQVRTPPGTRTWQPLPHATLLDQVCHWLARCGYQITSESHTLGSGDQHYFGVLDVTTDKDGPDYQAAIGVRNAHNRRFAAGVVLGNRVICCSNLMFEGEISLSRKHSRHIRRDLPTLVRDAVRGLDELRTRQDQRIERYRTTRLSDRRVHDLLVRSLDRKVIPASWIPRVVTEWRNPSHAEFTTGGRTAWRLANAFSEVWKKSRPERIAERSRRLHRLLDTVHSASVVTA